MSTNPPFPIAMGQRTLAAIVFTDVVGYSARMQKEEQGTLTLLEQDFAIMKKLSDKHSGAVLKTTGDGLLIYFASAVHAVTWAIETQRHFAARARTELLTKILRHRVGVHVGDVFRTEDDVVGDGVNIAARVQAEAPTGGVCISQAAYDMVKSKMELHVARMSARQLKNISEPVPMYQILLDGPDLTSREPDAATRRLAVPLDPATKRRRVLLTGLALAAIAGGGIAIFLIRRGHEEQLAESQAVQAALGRALLGATAQTGPANASPSAASGKSAGPDFARLTRPKPAEAATSDPAIFAQANESVAALDAWRQAQLARTTRSHPLLVQDLDDAMAEWPLYAGAAHRLYFTQGGATRKMDWNELPRDKQGAIIVSLLRDAAELPDAAVRRGAEAFAYLHGLPEMAGALIRNRPAGAAPR